jgi:hypothetical protein|tara:strand:+ start:1501 stop:1725 length:225 start_codon:yes stop_codon:yes gene_type:complete
MYQDKMGLFKKGKKKIKDKAKQIKGRFTIDNANLQIDTLNRQQGTNIEFLSRETMRLQKARRDARARRRDFRGN